MVWACCGVDNKYRTLEGRRRTAKRWAAEPNWAHPCLLQQSIDLWESQDPISANLWKDPSDPCITRLILFKAQMQLSGVQGFHSSLSRDLVVKVLKMPRSLGYKCSQYGFFFLFCCSSFVFVSLLIPSNLTKIKMFNWRPCLAQKIVSMPI